MSWYFFGGFSANLIEPSGVWRNHSGCDVTYGWSGEAWMATSIASSMPCASTASRKWRNSARPPSSGATASWPPSTEPMPYGDPTSSGPAPSVLLRPLRFVRPMGWIGGR